MNVCIVIAEIKNFKNINKPQIDTSGYFLKQYYGNNLEHPLLFSDNWPYLILDKLESKIQLDLIVIVCLSKRIFYNLNKKVTQVDRLIFEIYLSHHFEKQYFEKKVLYILRDAEIQLATTV